MESQDVASRDASGYERGGQSEPNNYLCNRQRFAHTSKAIIEGFAYQSGVFPGGFFHQSYRIFPGCPQGGVQAFLCEAFGLPRSMRFGCNQNQPPTPMANVVLSIHQTEYRAMIDPDLWLRQQLWQQLWNGPGAVSAYLTIPMLLLCAGLSPIISSDFEAPSLCITSVSVLLSVFLILVDQIGSCRKHHRGLLRFSVTKSLRRIEKIAVKSSEMDRFFNALWLNAELESRFRSRRFESFELMVQALDCLSRTAVRYGRSGKRIFEANRHPIVNAIQLFECLPFADAEEEFEKLLKARLEAMPEFDPEGWALRLVVV